jgi:hypothetical protein
MIYRAFHMRSDQAATIVRLGATDHLVNSGILLGYDEEVNTLSVFFR